jgi:hypothetical protein
MSIVVSELPVSQFHEGKSSRTTGDNKSAGGIISPADEIPPANYTENHAQNDITGDTGDIVGISVEDRPENPSESSYRKTVTSKGITFYCCPYCNPPFQNIHPEEIARHIKYDHDKNKAENASMSDETGTIPATITNQKVDLDM